jgi:8-oxo-dGTP pyrophosphatase MutT (NUDIX family)
VQHKTFKVNLHALIRNNLGQTLILKRGDYWVLPGGRLEDDQSPEAGLRRELREETGLEDIVVKNVLDVGLSDSKETLLVIFECESKESSNIQLSSEHSEFAWVTKADANTYNFEFEAIKEKI